MLRRIGRDEEELLIRQEESPEGVVSWEPWEGTV